MNVDDKKCHVCLLITQTVKCTIKMLPSCKTCDGELRSPNKHETLFLTSAYNRMYNSRGLSIWNLWMYKFMQVEVHIHSVKPCTFHEQWFMSAHAFQLSMLLSLKYTYCKTVELVRSFINILMVILPEQHPLLLLYVCSGYSGSIHI